MCTCLLHGRRDGRGPERSVGRIRSAGRFLIFRQQGSSMTATRDEGPLQGVRVLDFCHFLAGPYATLAMSEMGADVIKVEDHGRLDAARSVGPHFMGQQSVYFASLNWGKRSIAVKLRDPDGYEIVQQLVRNSDVVVDNFSPKVMEKLGLAYDTLSTVNPRIICCSLSGYGAGA